MIKQKGLYEDGVCSLMRKDCSNKSGFSGFGESSENEPLFKKCYEDNGFKYLQKYSDKQNINNLGLFVLHK